MPRPVPTLVLFALVFTASLASSLRGQDDEKAILQSYRAAAAEAGDAARGKRVFQSKESACTKCHVISGKRQLAGPSLAVIGDKYTRDQLIKSVLEPSASIHPDYASQIVITNDGKSHTGILRRRTDSEIQLLDAEGKLLKIPLEDIEEQKRSPTSLMPSDMYKTVKQQQFVDLIEYLSTLR